MMEVYMAKVIVLGGCGAVGSIAVKTLAAQDAITEIVIGDWNIAQAQTLAKDLVQGLGHQGKCRR